MSDDPKSPAARASLQPPVAVAVERDVPVCIDLDGTLVRTDCLWEILAQMLFRQPFRLACILLGAWRGRAWLKCRVAFCSPLAAESLPYNTEILDFIKREKAAGRRVLLVSASDQLMADAVGRHLKLFDEVIGSNGVTNLRGKAKAALLVEKFGRGGFDYAGDSGVDIPVWEAARRAFLVSPSLKARSWSAGRAKATTLGGPRRSWKAMALALRPQHWVKNTLVFLPLLTAHAWHQPQAWWRLVEFFLGLCFGASAVYLINDLADIESDRRHQGKWRRPVASGALPIPWALLALPLCMALAVFFCSRPGWDALGWLAGYLAATTAYSFYLKRIPVLDILFLSGFYVYRVVAGAALAPVELSPWLRAFAMFLFLSLAAAKRYVELTTISEGRRADASRGYVREDYPIIAAFGVNCGCLAVLILGLYLNSDIFQKLYERADVFWLLCPLLLYWLVRIWLLAGRRQLHDDPVIFALTDKVTWLIALLGALVFYVAMTGRF